MITRMLHPSEPAWQDVEALLIHAHGKHLADFSAGPGLPSLVLGLFVDETLAGFSVFQDYRQPGLHVGSALDTSLVSELLEHDEVALFQIALLHGEEEKLPLKESAAALVRGFEAWLEERYERRALFISTLVEGNRKARPLYRSLGFKPLGKPASLMSLDLPHMKRALRRIPQLPEGLTPRFFDEASGDELWHPDRGFAPCYAAAFLPEGELPELTASLRAIVEAPDFSWEMSLLLIAEHEDEPRVVAFMLAEKPEPDRVHVSAAGVLPHWRGQRLPQRATHALMPRIESSAVTRASFVTSRSRVVRLTLKAFGAKEMDRLQTLYTVG